MGKQEQALKQVEIIQNIVHGGNKIFFSGTKLIIIGLILCFVPVLEIGLNHVFNNFNETLHIIFHAIFYYVLSVILIKLFTRKKSHIVTLPKILQKAFDLHETILFVVIFCDIALIISHNYGLIMPLNLILFGLLFDLFGRFSMNIIRCIAISYIVIGVINIALLNVLPDNIWIIEIIYLGLGYIVSGFLLKKYQYA